MPRVLSMMPRVLSMMPRVLSMMPRVLSMMPRVLSFYSAQSQTMSWDSTHKETSGPRRRQSGCTNGPAQNSVYYLSVKYDGKPVYIQTKYKILSKNQVLSNYLEDEDPMEIDDDDNMSYKLVNFANNAFELPSDLSTVMFMLKCCESQSYTSRIMDGIGTECTIEDGRLVFSNGLIQDWISRSIRLLNLCTYLDNKMIIQTILDMIRTKLESTGYTQLPVDNKELRLKRLQLAVPLFGLETPGPQ